MQVSLIQMVSIFQMRRMPWQTLWMKCHRGQPMVQHNGIALEAQALPDTIHSDLKRLMF